CATCTAMCGSGLLPRRTRAGCTGAAAGTAAAPTARRRTAAGARRRTGTTTSASVLPEFPSGSGSGERGGGRYSPGGRGGSPRPVLLLLKQTYRKVVKGQAGAASYRMDVLLRPTHG